VNKVQVIEQEPGQFIIAGDLTFSTIDKKTANAIAFLASAKEVTLDLSQVGQADSAGLALMIEWVKYARGKRCHAVFKNIPEQLRSLAKLGGLEIFASPIVQAEREA